MDYADGEQTLGPVSDSNVEALIQQSVISPATWMLAEGSENWILAHDSPFKECFPADPMESATTAKIESLPHPSDISNLTASYQKISSENDWNKTLQDVLTVVLKCLLIAARWLITTGLNLVKRWKEFSYSRQGRPLIQSGWNKRKIVITIFALWLLIILINFPIDYYEHRHGDSAHIGYPIRVPRPNATPSFATASPMAGPSTATASPSFQPSTSNFIVKGLYIGMPKEEAKEAIIINGRGKVTVRDTVQPRAQGYDILLDNPDIPGGQFVGGIWIDSKNGTVRFFYFETKLSNFLFNTEDQSPAEFAQTFINAYNVPTLTPTTFSGVRCWSYVSPYGWTLRITTDKTVDVVQTPDRSFD